MTGLPAHDHAGRRDRLRAELADAGCDALLVTSLVDVRYLTGFTGSNAALVVGRDGDTFGTDGRYVTQAATEAPDLVPVVDRDTATTLIGQVGRSGRLGFQAEHVTVAQHAAWAPLADLVATTGLVSGLRRTKDDSELAALAEACRISDAALAALLPRVRVGVTEQALARALEALMLDLGATAVSFDTIVAGGPNSAIPHHSPTHRPVAAGDLLKIDFGAEVEGYHADETRTFVVGAEPEDWQREIHALVASAQAAGIAALAVGTDVRAVDAAARDVIAAAGYGEQFGHGLGHGVGLEIHEAPMMGPRGAGILGDRTPVTVEPGVYLPGRGGVRIEDTLVVRPGGPESLTTTTRELLVLG